MQVRDCDLVPENLDSIDNLVRFVKSRVGAAVEPVIPMLALLTAPLSSRASQAQTPTIAKCDAGCGNSI